MTLRLDGEVTLDRLTAALQAWRELLHEIDREISPTDSGTWNVVELAAGSAIVATERTFEEAALVSRFDEEISRTATAMRSDSIGLLPSRYQASAQHLVEAGGMDSGLGLVISDDDQIDFEIPPYRTFPSDYYEYAAIGVQTAASPPWVESIGTVSGKLQWASTRKGREFSIQDDRYQRSVRCKFDSDQLQAVREKLDEQVIVRGLVRRDSETGRPLQVVDIVSVELAEAPATPHAWRRGVGALRSLDPSVPSEVLIRRLRDA